MATLNTFPLDDTEYSAADFGQYMMTRTAGVYSADANLAVTPVSGMQIQIAPGLAWLTWGTAWGVCSRLADAETFTIATAHATLHRIDTVIVRADILANEVKTLVVTGTPASSPIATAPVRSTQYYDIVLAHIRVNAGATSITAAVITDKRLDESVCGLMRDGVTQIPTSTLQAQASALITDLEDVIHDIEAGSATMLKSVYDPAGYAEQMAPLSMVSPTRFSSVGLFNQNVSKTTHYEEGSYLVLGNTAFFQFTASYTITTGSGTNDFLSLSYSLNELPPPLTNTPIFNAHVSTSHRLTNSDGDVELTDLVLKYGTYNSGYFTVHGRNASYPANGSQYPAFIVTKSPAVQTTISVFGSYLISN